MQIASIEKRFGAAMAAGLVALAFSASPGWTAEDPIKIPVITALTGPLAVLGQDSKKGAEMAEEEINRSGGIKGRPLQLEIVDTQGKPEIVRREMERLTKLEHAPLIVGCEISAGTASAAQFAEAAQVPFLNVLAVSADILERGYKWYFAQQITGDDEAAATLAYLNDISKGKDLSQKSFALLYEDSPRGAGTAQRVKKLFADEKLKIVAENSYNRADRNLLPVIRKVQDAKPDIVIWAGYAEDVVAGLKAAKQLDFYPYILGIGGGLGDPRLPELVDTETLKKVHASNVDYYSPDISRVKSFTDAYTQKYKVAPSSYAGMCNAGVMTMKAVLEKTLADKSELSPTSIRDVLKVIKVDGADTRTGAKFVQFDASGRNIGARAMVSQWIDGNKKVTVFPPEIALTSPAPLP